MARAVVTFSERAVSVLNAASRGVVLSPKPSGCVGMLYHLTPPSSSAGDDADGRLSSVRVRERVEGGSVSFVVGIKNEVNWNGPPYVTTVPTKLTRR
jgi:hypothetical protein